jgi:Nucleotidyl transferase AbiEii toxin, Type IV TA system
MEALAFVDKVRVLVFLNQTLIAQATVAHFERLGDPVMAIQKTGEESTSNSPTSAPSGGSLFSNTRHASTIPWLPTGSRQKGRELPSSRRIPHRIGNTSFTLASCRVFVYIRCRVFAQRTCPRDPTLVRHVYDLHMIRAHYDLAEVALLAREIMLADAAAYGHQFPAYRANPVAETLRAVAGLVADPGFAGRYAAFQRDMVYGERADFETAVAAVVALAAQVEAAEVPAATGAGKAAGPRHGRQQRLRPL